MKKQKIPRTSIKRQLKKEVKLTEPMIEPKSTHQFQISKKSLIISSVILVILLGVGFVKRGRDEMMRLKTTVIPSAVEKIVGDPSVQVKEIANFKEVNGVYEFELNLDYGGGNVKKFTSYITKNGKIFFTAGIKVSELTQTTSNASAKVTCDTMKKSDAPVVVAYVVSQCPYGLQMQRVMNKMVGEQQDLEKNIAVKYIGSVVDGKVTSMHGEKEAEENLRQICIREEQKNLYWSYVSCYMKEGKTDGCLASTGVNLSKLQSCQSDANKGIAYAKKDFDEAQKLGIGSSPTLVVNGDQVVSEFDFGGRTPDALKSIVCCSSNTKPGFCSKELSKDAVPASFSVTDTGTGTANAQANCGN